MCHAVASRLAAGWLGHRADRKHGLDRVLGLRGGEGGIYPEGSSSGGLAMLIADPPCLVAGEHSLTQRTHALVLPFLVTDRFSQQKIFQDEFAFTGG